MSQVDNLDKLLQQLRSQAKKENYEKVILLASQVLELEPTYTEAYYLRGNAKAGLGNLAGAIKDMTATLEIEPNHILALIKRAEYAKLIWSEDIGKALRLFPDYCKQRREDNYPAYQPKFLPKEATGFYRDAWDEYQERAGQAEEQGNWRLALHYWQAFYDIGGTLDWEAELVLKRLEYIKAKITEHGD